jgi:hypothetical protein
MNQQLSTALAELPGFPMAATKPSAAHSRRCSVCHHPDRIWIELKFIEWHRPTRIAEAKSANSDPQQHQHTPAQVPHSKQPKTPESWLSIRQKMIDPNITEEQKDAPFQKVLDREKGFAHCENQTSFCCDSGNFCPLFSNTSQGVSLLCCDSDFPGPQLEASKFSIATLAGIRFRMWLFIKQM